MTTPQSAVQPQTAEPTKELTEQEKIDLENLTQAQKNLKAYNEAPMLPVVPEEDNKMMALHYVLLKTNEAAIAQMVREQKTANPDVDMIAIVVNIDEQIVLDLMAPIREQSLSKNQQFAVFPALREKFAKDVMTKWVPREVDGKPYSGPPPYRDAGNAIMAPMPPQFNTRLVVFHGGRCTVVDGLLPLDEQPAT